MTDTPALIKYGDIRCPMCDSHRVMRCDDLETAERPVLCRCLDCGLDWSLDDVPRADN